MAQLLGWLRWLLVIPSPSRLALGPTHYGAAERRYVRLRVSGQTAEAYPGADRDLTIGRNL